MKILTLLACLWVAAPVAAQPYTVLVNGQSVPAAVMPNTSITVFVAGSHGSPTDWINLVPVGTPEPSVWGVWRYLNGQQVAPPTGVLAASVTFPAQPVGVYEARYYCCGSWTRLATSPPITVANTPGYLLPVLACLSAACVQPAIGAIVELHDHLLTTILTQVTGNEGLAGFYVPVVSFLAPYVVVRYGDQTRTLDPPCLAGCLTTVNMGIP